MGFRYPNLKTANKDISIASAHLTNQTRSDYNIEMDTVNITQAKAQLSKLIEEVANGSQVIISRAGKPVAVLSPYKSPGMNRKPGALKGKIKIAKDFDKLPKEIEEAFGMK